MAAGLAFVMDTADGSVTGSADKLVAEFRDDLFTYMDDGPEGEDETNEISNDDSGSQHSESDDDDDELQHLAVENAYELRPRRRTDLLFDAAWIDQDQSGNYDPDANADLPSTHQRHHRCLGDEAEEARRGERKRRRLEAKEACIRRDHVGCPGVVTIKVKSDALKQRVASWSTNWPPGACDLETPHLGIFYLPNPTSEKHRSAKKSTTKNQPRPSLVGQIEARGCWGCVDLGGLCSLISDFPAWPCETCASDGHECELVTLPERKLPCERCKSRKLLCPYNYLEGHTQPCRPCQNAGARCIAGPAENGIRLRISLDRDWNEYPAPKVKPRKSLPQACLRCEEAGKDCSLLNGQDSSYGCIICEIEGVPCDAATGATAASHKKEEITSRPKKGDAASHKEKEQDTKSKNSTRHNEGNRAKKRPIEKASDDELEILAHKKKKKHISKPSLPKGSTRREIVTKLCHPITFGDESNESDISCDFCTTASYAVFGLGQKRVSVVDSGPTKPFTEISGGHTEAGESHTHICSDCTMRRFCILTCQDHDLVPFRSAESAIMNINDALERLLENKPDSSDVWCSLCPALALYGCTTASAIDDKGCGLVLCETCAVEMTGRYDYDLMKMLEEANDEVTDSRPFGYRADLELMKPGDGPLARYMARL